MSVLMIKNGNNWVGIPTIKGEQGNDGHTPVKGVDYFTSDDIASLNIPSKTSDLNNDSGYITNSVTDLTNYTTTTDMNTALSGKQNTLTAGSNISISSDTISSSVPNSSASTVGGIKTYFDSTNQTLYITTNGSDPTPSS